MFCKLSIKKKLGVIFSMITTLNHDQESKATRKSNPRLFTHTKITWDPTGVRPSDGHLVRIPRGQRSIKLATNGKRHPTLLLIPRLFLLER